MGMEEEGSSTTEEEELSAFDMYGREFLDDTLPMEDRLAALKAAIMECTSGYEGDSGGDKKAGKGKGKADGGLALIFGKE